MLISVFNTFEYMLNTCFIHLTHTWNGIGAEVITRRIGWEPLLAEGTSLKVLDYR